MVWINILNLNLNLNTGLSEVLGDLPVILVVTARAVFAEGRRKGLIPGWGATTFKPTFDSVAGIWLKPGACSTWSASESGPSSGLDRTPDVRASKRDNIAVMPTDITSLLKASAEAVRGRLVPECCLSDTGRDVCGWPRPRRDCDALIAVEEALARRGVLMICKNTWNSTILDLWTDIACVSSPMLGYQPAVSYILITDICKYRL